MSANFIDHSEEVLSAFAKAKKNALTAIGITAERHAKKKTPVDTGRLRNSITHAEDKDSTYIGTNVEYGPYVELGSRGRPGAHMLHQAASNHSDEYKKLAKQAFENAD